MVRWEGNQCKRAWIEVELEALAHNTQQIKRLLSPSTALMAIVKADAYGHGAVTVAQTVLQHGATCLGVATIPEGIELREAGIQAPILILGATNTVEQVEAIVRWKLQPTLCTPQQALMFSTTLAEMVGKYNLLVHLKIDTGMSRLGILWEQAGEFAKFVKCLPHLQIASIYSHLATADNPDRKLMHLQQTRYQEVINSLQQVGISPPTLHLANSAATLLDSAFHYDLVRVGLAIYGLYPASHLRNKLDLKPALQVKARVTQVKTTPAGTGISYGQQYITEQEMLLAVVGIGYADGVPRALSNQITVLIRGQHIPQVGTITMDQLMLDASTIPDLCEGEIVTLLGQDGGHKISADDWANTLNTISWEVLCGFKHRLPRVPVGSALALDSITNTAWV